MGCVTSREKSLRESGLYVFVNEFLKENNEIFKNTNYVMDKIFAYRVDLYKTYFIRGLITNKLNCIWMDEGVTVISIDEKYFPQDSIFIMRIHTSLKPYHKNMYVFENVVGELQATFSLLFDCDFACIF